MYRSRGRRAVRQYDSQIKRRVLYTVVNANQILGIKRFGLHSRRYEKIYLVAEIDDVVGIINELKLPRPVVLCVTVISASVHIELTYSRIYNATWYYRDYAIEPDEIEVLE